MTDRSRRAGMLTRVVCALSLLLLGLAHQAPQVSAEPAYNGAEYGLPDGSYASLCVTVTDTDGRAVPPKPNCEVCRLAASVILPGPDSGSWLHLEFASLHNPPVEAHVTIGARAVEQPKSRGPPALV
ncbi:hypothetical protein HGP14_17845 [Rhizobium sp. P32RR-XVIII]|uniref:hypothetical protein n=1 Tax=Rhizobium sp. P32RR-XVIII TaxID=2726738 RepID=UPI001456F4C0|nr:hypothetical protein [Rhizobium sp. P32RR-XVIII]